MLQIKDTLVSLDLIERRFLCDLASCKGECCIEGDAGAPISKEELADIESVIDKIKPYLTPAALKVLEEEGVAYTDSEGDLVTSLVGDRECVFTTYGRDGMCLCAIEKAFREGAISVQKPISCALYPVRLKEYGAFTAVNYHRWKICRCAETLGRQKNVRAYEFLRGPLERRFGKEWWEELDRTAKEYIRQYGDTL